jgi:putative membrane protein
MSVRCRTSIRSGAAVCQRTESCPGSVGYCRNAGTNARRSALENRMTHQYWNDWYFGWGWFLWFGVVFLIFSSIGNWGYTYQAHSKVDRPVRKPALDILDERYAKGEINREDYGRLKAEISAV